MRARTSRKLFFMLDNRWSRASSLLPPPARCGVAAASPARCAGDGGGVRGAGGIAAAGAAAGAALGELPIPRNVEGRG
jgi:hypothetical protein